MTHGKKEHAAHTAHDAKQHFHNREHDEAVADKQGAVLPRHGGERWFRNFDDGNFRHACITGNGHSVNEHPKKEGAGGKGTWGSVNDEIKDALAERE